MTIDIQRSDVEEAIRHHMASGAFSNVDELLSQALAALPATTEWPARTGGQALIDAFEPIRGLLTDEEVDTLFARDRSPDRELNLL